MFSLPALSCYKINSGDMDALWMNALESKHMHVVACALYSTCLCAWLSAYAQDLLASANSTSDRCLNPLPGQYLK